MTPDALDQSWSYADPAAAQAAGIKYVSMYLSWDSSKNITAGKVRAYHRHGIAVGANWESQAGAPLKGAAQGRADAAEAVRQVRDLIREVGYAPKTRLAITFSCDQDVSAGQFPQIDAYFRAAGAVVHAAGFGVGVYGEAALVSHLHAAGLTDFEWQTLAWSGGVVSPQADLYQYAINKTLGGASVDFDRIIHPAEIGAWWPPGHELNTGDDMSAADVAAINQHDDANTAKIIAAIAAGTRQVDAHVAAALAGVYAKLGLVFRGDATHPDNLKALHDELDRLSAAKAP